MKRVSKKVIKIIESSGFSLGDVVEQNGSYYVEMNQSTLAGEDWQEIIWFNGTTESFINAVKERYDYFDVDEEAETWIQSRGQNGVPNSIQALLNDAEWKRDKLKELVERLIVV